MTVEYDEERRPTRVHTVVVSTQHDPDIEHEELGREVIEHVVRPAVPPELLDERTIFHVNPTGRFVVGGPQGDCGLTGRKIIVDTYGGVGSHGGGAFSGKDPTKVDRSASYMARHVAKNLVAAGLAERVAVQLAYAIGVAEPVSVHVDTFGTGLVSDRDLERLVREDFPLTPGGIIDYLDLRRPIYRETAAYGHFGRSGDGFTWEKTERAGEIRSAAGNRRRSSRPGRLGRARLQLRAASTRTRGCNEVSARLAVSRRSTWRTSALAPEGDRRIDWAELQRCRSLRGLRRRFREEKPLDGLRIGGLPARHERDREPACARSMRGRRRRWLFARATASPPRTTWPPRWWRSSESRSSPVTARTPTTFYRATSSPSSIGRPTSCSTTAPT